MDQLIDVWTGASIEAAFRNLHAAEVAMVPLLSEEELRARIPEVFPRPSKCSSKDPRKRAAVKHLREAAERNCETESQSSACGLSMPTRSGMDMRSRTPNTFGSASS